MATAPFNIDDTVPASSDLISQYPTPARAFRDIVDSWLKVDHNTDPGGHKWVTLENQGSAPASPPTGHERLYRVGTRLYLRGSGGAFTRVLTGSVAAFNTEGLVASDLVGTGALDSGSITSGFGDINIGSSAFTGDGSGLTDLNASVLATGTVADARMAVHTQGVWNAGSNTTERVISPAKLAAAISELVDAPDLSNLNASNLTSGTVASARISGSYTGITGTGALNAGSITSGFGAINVGSSAISGGAIAGTTGTFTGTVTFGSILARNSAGTINIRPNGAGSTSGQMNIETSGNVTINGTLTVTG